jgi:segregation and condensation protein A
MKQLSEQAIADGGYESVSLYRLLRVFERLVARMDDEKKAKRVHTVYNFNYTIQEQRAYLQGMVKVGEKIDFEQVFLQLENRIHAVVTFLALLELLNAQELTLVQGEGYNNFWLSVPEETEETITE